MKIPTVNQLIEIMNTAEFGITCMKKRKDHWVLETTKLEKDIDGIIKAMAKAIHKWIKAQQ